MVVVTWFTQLSYHAGTSPQFPLPTVGDRVKVTGAYVIDIREGGHAEIHPAFAMSKIS